MITARDCYDSYYRVLFELLESTLSSQLSTGRGSRLPCADLCRCLPCPKRDMCPYLVLWRKFGCPELVWTPSLRHKKIASRVLHVQLTFRFKCGPFWMRVACEEDRNMNYFWMSPKAESYCYPFLVILLCRLLIVTLPSCPS